MATETNSIRYSTKGDIAVIEIDNPPLNAMAQPIWDGLEQAFARAARDPEIRAIVLVGAGRVFSAGADIREFEKPVDQLMLPFALNEIERGVKPIVASLHGVALGGGLELAVGCHFRVAAPGTQLGHPEVTLGLLPGAGGTQRLPRLIGVQATLELITGGRLIDAAAALALGLIDKISSGEAPIDAGIAFAREILADRRPIRRTCDMIEHVRDKPAAHAMIAAFRRNLPDGTPVRAAQESCLRAVAACIDLPLEEGLLRERELFIACMATPEHEALRAAFLAKRAGARK